MTASLLLRAALTSSAAEENTSRRSETKDGAMPIASRSASIAIMLLTLMFMLAGVGFADSDRENSVGAKKIKELLSKSGLRVEAAISTAEAQAVQSTSVSPRSLEVRVRWASYATNQAQVQPDSALRTAGGGFSIGRIRQIEENVALPRSPELSETQVVIAAVDTNSQLRSWAIVPDARILRAEHGQASGELSRRVLHHTTSELVISVPDDPAIVELRFFAPRWSGTDYSLQLMGVAPFRAVGR